MISKALKSGFIEAKLKTINIFTGLLIAGLSIKIIGLETIGLIQLYQSFYLFVIGILGIQAIQTALFHTISQYENKKKYISEILATINLILLLIILIIFSIIVLYLKKYFEPEQGYNFEELLHILIFVSISMYFDIFGSIKIIALNGFGNFNKISYINGIITSVSHIVLLFYFLIYKSINLNSLYVYVTILLLFSILKYAILSNELKKYVHLSIIGIKFKYLFSMKLMTKVAYIGSLSAPFSSQLDKILVALFGGIGSVPIYYYAQMALSVIHSFLLQTYQVYLKNNSEIAKTKYFLSKRTFFIQCWSIFFVAICGYSIMVWVLPYLFYYIFPAKVEINSLYYVYLAASQGVIIAGSMMNNNILISYKKIKILAMQEWINSFLIFGLSILFGSQIGGLGVALARLGFIFQFIHSGYYIQKVFSISLLELLQPYIPIGIFVLNLVLSFIAWNSDGKILYILLAIVLTLIYIVLDCRICGFVKKPLFKNARKAFFH